jgi:hypothetical protein
MKKTYRSLAAILAAMIVMTACQPDKLKDYEKVTAGNISSIAGTWTGTSVLQRDNDAERKNFPYKSMDVTAPLEFTKVKLTLQANNGQPGTFNIDHGSAPPIFKITSGTWKVDNTEKVGVISLISAPDTIRLVLGSYNLIASNKMQLRQSRTLLGKDAITYEFNFSK